MEVFILTFYVRRVMLRYMSPLATSIADHLKVLEFRNRLALGTPLEQLIREELFALSPFADPLEAVKLQHELTTAIIFREEKERLCLRTRVLEDEIKTLRFQIEREREMVRIFNEQAQRELGKLLCEPVLSTEYLEFRVIEYDSETKIVRCVRIDDSESETFSFKTDTVFVAGEEFIILRCSTKVPSPC